MSNGTILNRNEAIELIRDKLIDSDWIIVGGDIKSIKNLEGIKVLFIPCNPLEYGICIRSIFFAKKSKDLRKFLGKRVNKEEWKNLFQIFIEGRGNTFKTLVRVFKGQNQKEKAVSDYIQKILKSDQ
jgi:hypothetical protein